MNAPIPTLLTAERERELAARIRAGDQAARHELIEANSRLVYAIAHEYRCRIPFDDLVQEGNIGLIKATDGYDPDAGRFGDWAAIHIRGAIRKAAIEGDAVIRVPTATRRRYYAAGREGEVEQAVPLQDQDEPADRESRPMVSREALGQALVGLRPVEAMVIRERYGIGSDAPPSGKYDTGYHRTIADIGRDLGMHSSRVLQIQEQALGRLRRVLADDFIR